MAKGPCLTCFTVGPPVLQGHLLKFYYNSKWMLKIDNEKLPVSSLSVNFFSKEKRYILYIFVEINTTFLFIGAHL